MNIPNHLYYTKDHEWVQKISESNPVQIRMGITDFAQDALGDVVFVQVPQVGTQVTAGASISEVESTKSVSDIYAPIGGLIVEVNDALNRNPELINSNPYDEGWICVIESTEKEVPFDDLLDPNGYTNLLAQ